MALISAKDIRRFEMPHEPGSWVSMRPIGAGDMEMFEVVGGTIKVSLELLAAVIVAWSYELPPTLEVLRGKADGSYGLDLETYQWLVDVLAKDLLKMSGVRDEEEKKTSTAGLSPVSSRPNRASRRSSATS